MRPFLVLLVTCLLIGCSKAPETSTTPTTTTPQSTGKKLTAREALQLAQAAAKKWKDDAKLYTLSQRGVLQSVEQPEFGGTFDFADVKSGSSRRWIAEFYSDKSLEVLFVNVLDGKADSFPQSKFDKKPPAIGDKWVDSSDALQAARAEIEKALHITPDKYMALSRLESGEQFPTWTVEFYQSHGNDALYGVVVNAVNGKVVQSEKAD
jgi:hypothetical protein